MPPEALSNASSFSAYIFFTASFKVTVNISSSISLSYSFDKYGTNDHEINLEIAKIEGLSEKELKILDGKRSRKNEETLQSNSYERKICAYCDQRVAPNGVVGIKERLEDAKIRYKDKPLSVWSNEEKANYLIKCSLGIEKQIMKYCKLKPEDINDSTIETYIEKLKKYEI